jgi:hypothetical protein
MVARSAGDKLFGGLNECQQTRVRAMGVQMKLQFPAGSDVALVRITGDVKQCEPAHVRIVFPGGNVEVTRAVDGEEADYWVHVHVDRPGSGYYVKGETDTARIIDARLDAHNTGNGSSYLDAAQFDNPDLYHIAIRVKREELIES